jgi:hypothetical protein
MPRAAPSPLARIRKMCLSLPETTNRPSHGAPSFFIRDKIGFVNYIDNHHDDGRLALWCACPQGMRDGLVKAESEQYFVPPYVGVRGPDWDEVERFIPDAYVTVAPKKLVAAFLDR